MPSIEPNLIRIEFNLNSNAHKQMQTKKWSSIILLLMQYVPRYILQIVHN